MEAEMDRMTGRRMVMGVSLALALAAGTAQAA